VRARAFHSPQDGSEVTRVFDAVKDDCERSLRRAHASRQSIKQLFGLTVARSRHQGYNALVIHARPCGTRKLCARRTTHWNISLAGQLRQLAQSMQTCPFGQDDLLDRALSRAQSFQDGRDAVEPLAFTAALLVSLALVFSYATLDALMRMLLLGRRLARSSVRGVWLHFF